METKNERLGGKVNLLSNKKVIYIASGIGILWVALNVLMLCLSGEGVENPIKYFYPFNWNVASGLWAYDLSEFIIYGLLLPLLVISVVLYAFTRLNERARKRCIAYSTAFTVYCFLIAIVSLTGNVAMVGILTTMLNIALMIAIGCCTAGYIIDFFVRNRVE